MRTFFKYRNFPKTNSEIFQAILEVKSIIDCIREEKGYSDNHALGRTSDLLDNYIDAFEVQMKSFENEAWTWDESTKQYAFKKITNQGAVK